VTLERAGQVPGPYLLPYLNRLADLVWVLARAAEQAEARTAVPARPNRDRRRSEQSVTND
jgi:cob(I)alamin adenosyltransferase